MEIQWFFFHSVIECISNRIIDSKFVKAFMLTFRSFTTPHELLDLLIQRYNLEPPPGASEEEITNFSNQILKVVRLRFVIFDSVVALSIQTIKTKECSILLKIGSQMGSTIFKKMINYYKSSTAFPKSWVTHKALNWLKWSKKFVLLLIRKFNQFIFKPW